MFLFGGGGDKKSKKDKEPQPQSQRDHHTEFSEESRSSRGSFQRPSILKPNYNNEDTLSRSTSRIGSQNQHNTGLMKITNDSDSEENFINTSMIMGCDMPIISRSNMDSNQQPQPQPPSITSQQQQLQLQFQQPQSRQLRPQTTLQQHNSNAVSNTPTFNPQQSSTFQSPTIQHSPVDALSQRSGAFLYPSEAEHHIGVSAPYYDSDDDSDMEHLPPPIGCDMPIVRGRDFNSASSSSNNNNNNSFSVASDLPFRRTQQDSSSSLLPLPIVSTPEENEYSNTQPFPMSLPFKRVNNDTAESGRQTTIAAIPTQQINHDIDDGDDDESLYDPNTFQYPTIDMPYQRDPNELPQLSHAPSTLSTMSKGTRTLTDQQGSMSKRDQLKTYKSQADDNNNNKRFTNKRVSQRDGFKIHGKDDEIQDYSSNTTVNSASRQNIQHDRGVYKRTALLHYFFGTYIKGKPNFGTNLIHCYEDAAHQVDAGIITLGKLQKFLKRIQKSFSTFAESLTHDISEQDDFSKSLSGFNRDRQDWSKSNGQFLQHFNKINSRNFDLWTSNADEKDTKDRDNMIADLPRTYFSSSYDRAEAFSGALSKLQDLTQSYASATSNFARALEVELCEPLLTNYKDLEEKRKRLMEELIAIKEMVSRVRSLSRNLYRVTRTSRRLWEEVIRLEECNELLYTELYLVDPTSELLPSNFQVNGPNSLLICHSDPINSLSTIHGEADDNDQFEEPSNSRNSDENQQSPQPSVPLVSNGLPLKFYKNPSFFQHERNADQDGHHSEFSTTPTRHQPNQSTNQTSNTVHREMSFSTRFNSIVGSNNTTSVLSISYTAGDRKSIKNALRDNEKKLGNILPQCNKFFKEIESIQSERGQLLNKVYSETIPLFLQRCEAIERDRLTTLHVILHRFYKIYSTFLFEQTITKHEHPCSTMAEQTLNAIKSFIQPDSLFGQYIHQIQLLNIDSTITHYISDLQQPLLLQQNHVLLPCPTSLLSPTTLSSLSTHEAGASLKPFLRHTLNIEAFDPLFQDELSFSQTFAPNADSVKNQYYPQSPSLLPRVYRVDQHYNENTWLKDQWLSIVTQQASSNESTTMDKQTAQQLLQQPTITLETTATAFNSIYSDSRNFTSFNVPPNSYVLQLSDEFFQMDSTQNRCFSKSSPSSITFSPSSTNNNFNDVASPLSPTTNSFVSLEKSLSQPRESLLSKDRISTTSILSTDLQSMQRDGQLFSAPFLTNDNSTFTTINDLHDRSKYTFIELITIPGQSNSVTSFLSSRNPNQQISGTLPTSLQPSTPFNNNITNSNVNNNINNTSAPPPALLALNSFNGSSASTSFSNPSTTTMTTAAQFPTVSSTNTLPTSILPPPPQASSTSLQSPTINNPLHLSSSSPSRGYIPSQFLSPISVDETALVLAQCLVYPRLSQAFNAYLRANLAVENLQYWTYVRRFRTVPWQLDSNVSTSTEQQLQNHISHNNTNTSMTFPSMFNELSTPTVIGLNSPLPLVPTITHPYQHHDINNNQIPPPPTHPNRSNNSNTDSQDHNITSQRRLSGHRTLPLMSSPLGTSSGPWITTSKPDSTADIFNSTTTTANTASPPQLLPQQVQQQQQPPIGRHRRTNSVQSVGSYASSIVSTFAGKNNTNANNDKDSTLLSPGNKSGKSQQGSSSQPSSSLLQLLQYSFYPSTTSIMKSPQPLSQTIPLSFSSPSQQHPSNIYNRNDYLYSPECFIEQALMIFHTFLDQGSVREVNLPHHMIKPLRSLFSAQEKEFQAWKAARYEILTRWEQENPNSNPIVLFSKNTGIFGHSIPSSSTPSSSSIDITDQHQSQLPEPTISGLQLQLQTNSLPYQSVPSLPTIPPLKLLIHRNIFVETEYEIYQLLSRDQFTRFKSESQYFLGLGDIHRQLVQQQQRQQQQQNSSRY